ncbi:MAG: hypothetical protein H6858_02895 [Rhodospirillales bacterium]|nr:hypothetical protein [Alphaproteobacteria bacterium]MCB9976531.1 hypothetical protein [Rhodospirillales bacterium]
MHHVLFVLCALFATSVFSLPVQAMSEEEVPIVNEMVVLDETKANNFVNSLDDLAAFRQKLGDEGRDDPLRIRPNILAEKNYAPYRHAVEKMKSESPEDYDAIKQLAYLHEFTSAEDWAETADGVLLTYFYIQEEKEGRTIEDKMREQLRPDMLKMIPKDQMYRVDQALKMAHKINEVPEENERIVRSLLPVLEVGLRKNL